MKDMNQFLIIGLGSFGEALAQKLSKKNCEVMAIDKSIELINNISEEVTDALCADASDENVLKTIGVDKYDAVVVCIGDTESNIMVTLLCKQLGAKYIISKANSHLHKTVLEKVGSDKVIFPEEYMGEKVADMLTNPTMLEIARLTPNFSIIEIIVPQKWVGQSLIELNLRQTYKINLLLVKRKEEVIINFDGEFRFIENDELVICGETAQLDKLKKSATSQINIFN